MTSAIAGRRWVVALTVMLTAAVASVRATGQTADTAGVEQQVRTAQGQLLQAAIQGDKEAAGKFLADDLAWVGPNGQVENKAQVLAALPAPVESVDVQQVVPNGKTATLVAVVHMKDGTNRRLVQQWATQDGAWRVLAHESTPIRSAAAGTMGTPAPAGTSGGHEGAIAEARTVSPSLTSDTDRAVWRAQTEIVDLYSKGDAKGYGRLTATPFARVELNGQVYDRSQWLDLVRRNAKQPLKPSAIRDVQIHTADDGNLAYVTMEMVPFGPEGTPQSPERQLRIFARHGDQWQQVAAISTPIQPQ